MEALQAAAAEEDSTQEFDFSWLSTFLQIYLEYNGQAIANFGQRCQDDPDAEEREDCGWKETMPFKKEKKTFTG